MEPRATGSDDRSADGGETLLAVIGDIHADHRRLARVLARIAERRVDGILLVGDLGIDPVGPIGRLLGRSGTRDPRYQASLDAVFAEVESLGVPVGYVPGNHDLPDLLHAGNLDGGSTRIGALSVAGIGGAGPARFGFPYEWDEDEVRALRLPPCDVLLCHAPPARTPLDRLARRDRHVGSEALRERALAHDGVLVCGHIHESPGAVELGRSLCLNVGGLGEPFGRAQVGFVRASAALAGRFEVRHEDLESGLVRTWRRSERVDAER